MIVRSKRWIIVLGLAVLMLAGVSAWTRANAFAVGMIVDASQRHRGHVEPPSDVREALEVERARARVHAWVLDPPAGQTLRGTILVLHGIRDSKLGSLDSARAHVQRGYRAVVPDSRGHGESTGRYFTYGVEEAQDMVALVDTLTQRRLLVAPLFVVGSSYGASTAIQYAALDARVEKVVAISPFAALREVVPAYLRWFLGDISKFIPDAWVNARIDEAGRVAGFDPNRACPRCVAPRIRAQAFVIASRDDERIPYRQSVAVRDAIAGHAKLLLVGGAQHVVVGAAPGVPDAIARWLDAR